MVSKKPWWFTMQSISKYMGVHNTKYRKIHGGLQCKVSQIHDRSQYIVSQNTWWYNTWYLKIHSCSQYIVSKNTCYSQYIVSQNTYCSQYMVSQNTWLLTMHSISKYMIVHNT